jgi:hypothetical protein
MQCGNKCGEEIRRAEPGEYPGFEWVHVSGNSGQICATRPRGRHGERRTRRRPASRRSRVTTRSTPARRPARTGRCRGEEKRRGEDVSLSIGPAIGLPRLPAAPMPGSPEDTGLYEAYGPRFLAKAEGFVPWAQGHRFVRFEDEAEQKAATPWLVSRIWPSGWTRARAWRDRTSTRPSAGCSPFRSAACTSQASVPGLPSTRKTHLGTPRCWRP